MKITPFGPPPVLKEINEQLQEYLICPERLPIHDFRCNQEFWERDPDVSSLFHFDSAPVGTTLKVQRNLNTGEIIEFREVKVAAAGTTASNSMSFNRAPVPPEEATRGSASYCPFWPGGFPDPIVELQNEKGNADLFKELLTIPPGFTRGFDFENEGDTTEKSVLLKSEDFFKSDSENIINLMDMVNKEQNIFDLWKQSNEDIDIDSTKNSGIQSTNELSVTNEELSSLLSVPILPVLQISKAAPVGLLKGTEWAILLDTSEPIGNFSELLPNPAHKYPFELDTFQKQAILQLEKHNHVFVAAHTSAGKTVVAEYAIALSQKHLTRTIYTSPIKALSNQKYRDFKRTFKDVGLITGDFQINQTAACLIMTTEILRHMLYCGSDVTRDLEYVIFDEVHYINNEERGHVWEEILILLPAHVCIVLLSATVPNTIEFADWLGRTKQRKVYVVSTVRRPVPLQHYLYTGCGGASRDQRFLILNATGEFQMDQYHQANLTRKEKTEKQDAKQKSFKREPYRSNFKGYTERQNQTMWDGLIAHLKKKDLLPVVAFTLSRLRCDRNAESLSALDLTTEREKSHIHAFFEKCLKSLKKPDREIPQIVRMRAYLKRGIGVHHSGVLPIIKEVVEMMFQSGFVKLLFATETFAMGVNMPARTVVFDSIKKFDGKEVRVLLPAEYIQMAGRAGRRGLDSTGTVIIICKEEIPSADTLQRTLMGKPSQLESKFRLTYGMVLSLLRFESLSVESMMSHSFREAGHNKNNNILQKQLDTLQEKINMENAIELGEHLNPLTKFYRAASIYLESRSEIIPTLFKQMRVEKELIPGKVVLVTHKKHLNKLGLILSVSTRNDYQYKVLILNNQRNDTSVSEIIDENRDDNWYKMLSFTQEKIFLPEGTVGHEVLTVAPHDIMEITTKSIKVDVEKVLNDWDKRQLARFRDAPPGPTFTQAVQELHKICLSTSNIVNADDTPSLQYMDFLLDFKINDFVSVTNIRKLNNLKEIMRDNVCSTQIPNFESQFQTVYYKKKLEDEFTKVKFQLSHQSMSLYPEYTNRIALLQELKYVDMQNRVELKGRVACEIGMNELLITELVLRNTLTNLQPAEVAALLSGLVFQAKINTTPNISKTLEQGQKAIQNVYEEIGKLEEKYQISNVGCEESLNFGLVEVVYEWATDKPFADIMRLTDVQEGIIVRCIQQLNETLCDVRNAARLIGDPELQDKMEQASSAIKRDIVFAASLYTQKESL